MVLILIICSITAYLLSGNRIRPRPQRGQGWPKGVFTLKKRYSQEGIHSLLPFITAPAYTHCPNETQPSPSG